MKAAFLLSLLVLALPAFLRAQHNPAAAAARPSRPSTGAPPSVRITLDEALRLALEHNHALEAARSTILQSQALETTANLRPNPVLSWDAQFLPIFEPDKLSADYIDSQAQFDLGLAYTFEIGGKRQDRLRAARDVTEATRSTVADDQRTLSFNVGQQFVAAILAESTMAMLEAGVIRDALTVPDAAVLRDSENMPFVYLQSGANQFARRLVKIGERQDGRTEITDGLQEGDRVVGDGSLFLQFKNSLQH